MEKHSSHHDRLGENCPWEPNSTARVPNEAQRRNQAQINHLLKRFKSGTRNCRIHGEQRNEAGKQWNWWVQMCKKTVQTKKWQSNQAKRGKPRQKAATTRHWKRKPERIEQGRSLQDSRRNVRANTWPTKPWQRSDTTQTSRLLGNDLAANIVKQINHTNGKQIIQGEIQNHTSKRGKLVFINIAGQKINAEEALRLKATELREYVITLSKTSQRRYNHLMRAKPEILSLFQEKGNTP